MIKPHGVRILSLSVMFLWRISVRRVIVPSSLAYAELAKPKANSLQVQDCSIGRGPIPPQVAKDGDLGFGEFQRFKNIYCNPNRPYQPDLVLDVKLFGKRS